VGKSLQHKNYNRQKMCDCAIVHFTRMLLLCKEVPIMSIKTKIQQSGGILQPNGKSREQTTVMTPWLSRLRTYHISLAY